MAQEPGRQTNPRAALTLSIIFGAVVGLSLTLTGSLLLHDEAPTPTRSPPKPLGPWQPPLDGGSFDSPQQIIDRLSGAVLCRNPERVTPAGALEQVSCDDGNITIRTYRDPASLQRQIQTHHPADGDTLAGRNWTFHDDNTATLNVAWRRLGGHLVRAPCQRAGCTKSDSP